MGHVPARQDAMVLNNPPTATSAGTDDAAGGMARAGAGYNPMIIPSNAKMMMSGGQ